MRAGRAAHPSSSVPFCGRSATLETVTDHPEVRIGTTERERAQNALSEHFSQGRLDINEFEERSGLAAAARTVGDLARLFSDLPGGLPGALAAPPPDSRRAAPGPWIRRRAGPLVILLAFMVLIAVGLITGHVWMLFLLFPLVRGFQYRRWTRGSHHGNGPGPNQY